jgi:hypothetical protein
MNTDKFNIKKESAKIRVNPRQKKKGETNGEE